ncbi:MAG: transketolase C-terminal domain-containing protein [Patescibacteria group bacterium]
MESAQSRTYIEYINSLLRKRFSSFSDIVAYGQNINAGSRLAGFTRGLAPNGQSLVLNTTNTENAQVGFGFGLMLGGKRAVFLMKQLDFLYLGIDQIVNTYNIIRNIGHASGSFTIFPVTVDMGYEGPQSSSNNFADICSMARVDGYAITNAYDAERIIMSHLGAPGFRILSISQRLFKQEIIDPGKPMAADPNTKYVQYLEGDDATIVTFNFAFPYGWQLATELKEAGLKVALFNVNYMTPIDWKPILESVRVTKKLVIIEDSKSENVSAYALRAAAAALRLEKDILVRRTLDEKWLNPVSDKMDINCEAIIRELS